jgi:molecular chaperone GrpE (heat shock protein)
MLNQTAPKLSKWPFFAGDALLLLAASSIYYRSPLPLGAWQLSFVILGIAAAAGFGILPFVLEYHAWAKLAETSALTSVVSQVENLDRLASQISGATRQWLTVQEQADRTADVAKRIADRMSAEAKGFTEFLQRASEGEKTALRLEVDKLRRSEKDWLQVLVRMLDHVYALHQGALRSGQPNLIGQVGNFQLACRDAARRVGLAPFTADESEPFDPQRHQLMDGDPKATPDAVIAETLATGYTFQGRLLRPALVRLRNGKEVELTRAEPEELGEPSQLPLEMAQK